MLSRIREALTSLPTDTPPPQLVGYEAIGTEEDDTTGRDPSHVDGSAHQRAASQRGVYWAFWILGAGVLLAWNGAHEVGTVMPRPDGQC
jgi:hypothetical protein